MIKGYHHKNLILWKWKRKKWTCLVNPFASNWWKYQIDAPDCGWRKIGRAQWGGEGIQPLWFVPDRLSILEIHFAKTANICPGLSKVFRMFILLSILTNDQQIRLRALARRAKLTLRLIYNQIFQLCIAFGTSWWNCTLRPNWKLAYLENIGALSLAE